MVSLNEEGVIVIPIHEDSLADIDCDKCGETIEQGKVFVEDPTMHEDNSVRCQACRTAQKL